MKGGQMKFIDNNTPKDKHKISNSDLLLDEYADEIEKIAEENTNNPEILKDWEDDIHEQ